MPDETSSDTLRDDLKKAEACPRDMERAARVGAIAEVAIEYAAQLEAEVQSEVTFSEVCLERNKHLRQERDEARAERDQAIDALERLAKRAEVHFPADEEHHIASAAYITGEVEAGDTAARIRREGAADAHSIWYEHFMDCKYGNDYPPWQCENHRQDYLDAIAGEVDALAGGDDQEDDEDGHLG